LLENLLWDAISKRLSLAPGRASHLALSTDSLRSGLKCILASPDSHYFDRILVLEANGTAVAKLDYKSHGLYLCVDVVKALIDIKADFRTEKGLVEKSLLETHQGDASRSRDRATSSYSTLT
jgi:hypothetical protein